MTKNKKTQKKDFSHIETDKLRATFIENIETAEKLNKKLRSSKDIVIKVGEYLNSNDPALKDLEIVLQGFDTIFDHAGDEVMYLKVKPEDKSIIYHLTSHPDALKALQKISLEARKIGFTLIDSKTNIQEVVDMFKRKQKGTLKTKQGRHPGMDYLH